MIFGRVDDRPEPGTIARQAAAGGRGDGSARGNDAGVLDRGTRSIYPETEAE
jgi:hypothetical protein